jgi:hypothetical protein
VDSSRELRCPEGEVDAEQIYSGKHQVEKVEGGLSTDASTILAPH